MSTQLLNKLGVDMLFYLFEYMIKTQRYLFCLLKIKYILWLFSYNLSLLKLHKFYEYLF